MTHVKLTLNEIQTAIELDGAQWHAGSTSVSQLPDPEQELLCKLAAPSGEFMVQGRERILETEHSALQAASGETRTIGTPTSVDLRSLNGRNFVTAVKNQGACASGPAFAATSVVESTFKVQRNDPDMAVDLSEAHLFYCHAKSLGVNCSNGWSPDKALECYKNFGVVDEACFPYTAGDQHCRLCSDWQNRITRITGYRKTSGIADMKAWIATRGPLLATFLVYRDLLYYQGGVYRHVAGDTQGGAVCTAIIGYDDADGYWICKHQWGTSWGESGFLRIAYGECGIESLFGPYAVEGIEETGWLNSRKVLGLWSIDQDRNAWVYLDGKIGWRRLAADNDTLFFNLLTHFSVAKISRRPVNVLQHNGIITQAYVL